MAVYELNPLQDSRWARFVQQHPRASVFHSPPWLDALQRTYGYAPVVVSTCPVNEPLSNGLVFCQVKSWLTGRRLVSLPFSDHCAALVESNEQLDTLLMHVKRSVDDKQWRYVEIRPALCQPGHGTQLGQSNTYFLHRLDLTRGREQLFQGFHKDCVQRKIRRAEREQLHYEEGRSEAQLNKFYRLLVMTRKRQHLPPQPLAWFRGLIAAFGDQLKIRIASKDGMAVASILTLACKQVMTYKYGCSDARYNKFGGTALLFWRTIQEAQELGFEELDMGRSDLDNTGLVVFKEHWGATRSMLSYWRYPNRHQLSPNAWGVRLAKQLVSAAPDLSLEAAGSLLYRHIG